MSGNERDRAFLVRQATEGVFSQHQAAERRGMGVRQFKRLVRAWRAKGDAGLVSRQRGRPLHRRMSAEQRALISALLQQKYAGFGAKLATEKLWEVERIKVSAETGRRMQIDQKL